MSQTSYKGKRHPPYTTEEAAKYGSKGGKSAKKSRETVSLLSDLAQQILSAPCTSQSILAALREAGLDVGKGRKVNKVSHGVAVTANIIRLAESDDPRVANAAVRAYVALCELERRQAETSQAADMSAAGGVVILPHADDIDTPADGDANDDGSR